MVVKRNAIANKKSNLNLIREEIQRNQLILIISITILFSIGAALININSSDKLFNEDLQNTSELITRLYDFTKDYNQQDLCTYMDRVVEDLPEVDVISIVDKNLNRVYHTNHQLINTTYDGTIPDFKLHLKKYYTENDNGPSGPQRRTYSAIYDKNGNYEGFILTIRLQTSIMEVTIRTIELFLIITFAAILIEIIISKTLSQKIKQQFLAFAEDLEGTRFLVDSMRANNHDFTNKLHVILGLIQIGQYEKAISYIENISIIQRETVSYVMKTVENSSFAALLIGKIARASECNVKFILKEDICFKNDDVDYPSEALVTITGNLIENAIDAMNTSSKETKELQFGVYTKPGNLLIIVQDSGDGIPNENYSKIFENGFSTKGNGRGVGLYHTRSLIESLGGSISFESKVGTGTCFMVNLPARKEK